MGLTVSAGLATKTVAKSSLSVVNVDTTVQDRAVAFPTDARLLNKARLALVRHAHKLGVVLRQSYRDVGRAAFVRSPRYAHARPYNRAQAQTKKLRTYLGRIIRDIERKTQATPEHSHLARLLEISRRIWSQRKQRQEGEAPKLSVKTGQVHCVAAGHNMRKILKKLRLLCTCWRWRLLVLIRLRLFKTASMSPLAL